MSVYPLLLWKSYKIVTSFDCLSTALVIQHLPHCGPAVDTNRKEYQEYFLGINARGRGVDLTTLSHLCADCHEIWESQPPGNLRACPGLYRNCFTLCRINMDAPYCHTWPLGISHIFPRFLTNVRIFRKKPYWKSSVCFNFLYMFSVKYFSF